MNGRRRPPSVNTDSKSGQLPFQYFCICVFLNLCICQLCILYLCICMNGERRPPSVNSEQ